MSSADKWLRLAIAFSFFAGLFKVLGGVVGESKAVFVDALTSIANTLSIYLIYSYYRKSLKPPDQDHHYGHFRIALGGPVATLMLYAFVLGLVVSDLVHSFGEPYYVKSYAPIFASIGMALYAVAIAVARRVPELSIYYTKFTAIEFIEGLSTIASSVGGMLISFWIDYTTAVALALYLVYELWESLNSVVYTISDYSEKSIVEEITRFLNSSGFEVRRIRVRKVFGDIYQGDAIVKPENQIANVSEAVKRVEDEIRKRFKTDLVIKVE